MPLSSEAASSLEGRYRVETLGCTYNQKSVTDCTAGDYIEVSIKTEAREKLVTLSEIKDGKVLREWKLSGQQQESEPLVVTSLLTESPDTISSSEFRSVRLLADRRQVTRTAVAFTRATVSDAKPGQFHLTVRRSEEQEKSGADVEKLGETELTYQLKRE